MKIWRPTHCACVIEEVYQGTAIVGGGKVLAKCAAHADVSDAKLWDVLIGECRTVADVRRGLERLKSSADPIFVFDGSGAKRTLHVSGLGDQDLRQALEGRDVSRKVRIR